MRQMTGYQKFHFTMVELMIVIVIVALLAAASVPLYRSGTERARSSEITSGLGTVRTALRVYNAENDFYPTENAQLNNSSALENQGYISTKDFKDMPYVDASEFGYESDGDAVWGDIESTKSYEFDRYDRIRLTADGEMLYNPGTLDVSALNP